MPDKKTQSAKELKLTKAQALAVKASGKNILVSAGAGTGKTRVLVERFLHFVTSGEALVTEILALTFTDKAANEMKTRILSRFNELGLESARRELESAYISTIHAFAARLLREHPLEAGLDPDFRVIETEEAAYLREQALDNTLEVSCRRGSEAFELLRVYGENCIRGALLKVLDTARSEGKYLSDFFAGNRKAAGFDAARKAETARLFEQAGEKDLAAQWNYYAGLSSWDWKTLELYKEWCSQFSRKRGKKGDDTWPEIKRRCKEFYAAQLDLFMKPWQDRFEPLALLFEKEYEEKKRQDGALDFDDLQIYAVRLFKKTGSIYAKLKERYRKKFKQIMVDEFQDTNFLQLELIEQLSAGGNLFFVGDYKQSIYAFRGAEPQLFLDREAAYRSGEQGVSIPLADNFRTSGSVLEFMNGFFEGLWREDNIPFEPLVPCAEGDGSCGTEILVVRQEEDEPLKQARMREADHIAAKILQFKDAGAEFGDIAVLFQAMTDIALYEQALKKNGIPYYVLGGSGFYHQHEIRDMISFLSFLDNPLADIPLAASLRSPMFQVSDDALFWLSYYAKEKHANPDPKRPLYEGVKQYGSLSEIGAEDKAKIKFFVETAESLLESKDQLRLTELLDFILAKTSYELTALADPQGIRKYANLKKMINIARELESMEPLPIGAFLRALKRLEIQEARESEAQIEAEQSRHVVRLMSIHRSKGLEFPVVFVADMGHSKQSSEAKAVLARAGFGYAMQVRNEITFEMERPLAWQEIDEAENKKQKEEWKRLLYVAATRAKRHLIFSGVYREKKKDKELFREMSSWMDWIMASSIDPEMFVEAAGSIHRKKLQAIAERKDLSEFFENFEPVSEEKLIPSEELREKLKFVSGKIFDSITPVKPVPSRAIDLPVSAYAAYRKDPADYWLTYEIGSPESQTSEDAGGLVLNDDEISAADFGTAMHQVLEKLSFKPEDQTSAPDYADYYFRHTDAAQKKEARRILSAFLKSGLYRSISEAKRIYRELPFVLNERHGIIHGVIDLLYEDKAGDWHVLDYKTAVGGEDKVKASGYIAQISIYAHAVYSILGKAPLSGTLYFLKNDWAYRIDWKAEDYQALGGKIRDLQDQLLAYTLEKKGTGKE